MKRFAHFSTYLFVGAVAVLATQAPHLLAQSPTDSARIDRLERQLDVVTQELERLNLGAGVVLGAGGVEAASPRFGLAPAASKVYRAQEGVSIGGYGEFLYDHYSGSRENGSPSGKIDQLDALRGIVYVGYKFNDRLLFNSETEVEHASSGQAGEVSLEFAYVDYRIREDFGVRAGLLLVPMGLVNEMHEPPIFLGTGRSLTESRIIPSTWRESGIGVFGESDKWSYRAYVLNSFDGVRGGSSKAKGFSDEGLRGGRQKGSKALAEDMGLVGRVDYRGVAGLMLGGSLYYGNTGQGRELNGVVVDARAQIWEAHGRYLAHGWEGQALVAGATLDQAEQLNTLKGLSGDDSVGDSMGGWYVQLGYDVLWQTATEHQLLPYFRYEALNTQESVPTGFTTNPSNDLNALSLGLAWRPIGDVVLKMDYQIHSNAAETGVNKFSVALGYLF